MKIVVYEDDIVMSDNDIDKASVILDVNEDNKGFTIKRHTRLAPHFRIYPSCRYPHRHMSELRHIILAAEKED